MKVIFFGTPNFAAQVLSSLLSSNVKVVAVVTKPDKPQGRSSLPITSPVKNIVNGKNLSIPVLQPNRVSTKDFIDTLSNLEADLFIFVAYGEIVSKDVLAVAKKCCINLHPSLLPKYRGASPIRQALLDGADKTGISIIEMSEKMDSGDILKIEECKIDISMNFKELEQNLCNLGSKALIEVINNLDKIDRVPQDHSLATYVKKIDKSTSHITWNKPATVIYDQIRAFSPLPGAWCEISHKGINRTLKIYKAKVGKVTGSSVGSTIHYGKDGWSISCQKESISILELQLDGKKRMSIEDFYIGIPTPPKIVLH